MDGTKIVVPRHDRVEGTTMEEVSFPDHREGTTTIILLEAIVTMTIFPVEAVVDMDVVPYYCVKVNYIYGKCGIFLHLINIPI